MGVQPAKNLNVPNHATMDTVLVQIPVNVTQDITENFVNHRYVMKNVKTVANVPHQTHVPAPKDTTVPRVKQLFAKKAVPTAELAYHRTYVSVSSGSKEHFAKSQSRSNASFLSSTTVRSTRRVRR